MKMSSVLFFFFTLIFSTFKVWAETHGGGHAAGAEAHHPGMGSLIAPAFNFVVLFGFILYKSKAPMKKAFEQKAKKISEVLDRAGVKAKEAQVLLDLNNKKLSDVDHEAATIMKNTEEDVKRLALDSERDIKDKTEKMKSEAIARVEAEKKNMISELNKELINDVMKKTKALITSNSAVQKSLNQKMAQEIRQ